jgi:type II secretory pathway pseudopilin PulG
MTRRSRTAGFTVLELALALSIAAILMRLSMPMYSTFVRKAHAARAAADFNAVRNAAYAYFESSGQWPAEYGPGVMPPELEPYLPRHFSFDRRQYQLDWEHWTIGQQGEGTGLEGTLVGVSVVTDDADLGRTVMQVVGAGTVQWTAGDHYTFMIQSTLVSTSGARWNELR